MEKPRRFTIEYKPNVREFLLTIPKNIRDRIKLAIEQRLTVAPNDYGKPLTKEWKEHRRLRVGDYRVIYKVQDSKHLIFEETVLVLIVELDHRKQVYDH